jgi:hypothetical protein
MWQRTAGTNLELCLEPFHDWRLMLSPLYPVQKLSTLFSILWTSSTQEDII